MTIVKFARGDKKFRVVLQASPTVMPVVEVLTLDRAGGESWRPANGASGHFLVLVLAQAAHNAIAMVRADEITVSLPASQFPSMLGDAS